MSRYSDERKAAVTATLVSQLNMMVLHLLLRGHLLAYPLFKAIGVWCDWLQLFFELEIGLKVFCCTYVAFISCVTGYFVSQ